ncbi:bifunctional Cytochrome C oxidase subunit II [Babesia duncani]|uniref:Bifunctional Cytochrome C oxidase subunit II n=1 Tax=Babesia duncani TaxID=323732 RepID=A0AAD9UPK8_9APIC|nr:bifunctional Cytochrome C oxidase subunit II [Babesia duncani]
MAPFNKIIFSRPGLTRLDPYATLLDKRFNGAFNLGFFGNFSFESHRTIFTSLLHHAPKTKSSASKKKGAVAESKAAAADNVDAPLKMVSTVNNADHTSASVEDIALTFRKGMHAGTGLPKPVGPGPDLKSIEFGKPTGMYNIVREQHGDPRGHLQNDGRFRERYATDNFHWYDAYTDVPKQQHTIVNGELMIKGVETRPMEQLFGVEQTNIPFTPRRRLNLWGNHSVLLGAEFCFFWIPTLIIFSLAIPCYTMLYMMDEAVDTSMTVKVIGHQWYWVYEVESPPAE